MKGSSIEESCRIEEGTERRRRVQVDGAGWLMKEEVAGMDGAG